MFSMIVSNLTLNDERIFRTIPFLKKKRLIKITDAMEINHGFENCSRTAETKFKY